MIDNGGSGNIIRLDDLDIGVPDETPVFDDTHFPGEQFIGEEIPSTEFVVDGGNPLDSLAQESSEPVAPPEAPSAEVATPPKAEPKSKAGIYLEKVAALVEKLTGVDSEVIKQKIEDKGFRYSLSAGLVALLLLVILFVIFMLHLSKEGEESILPPVSEGVSSRVLGGVALASKGVMDTLTLERMLQKATLLYTRGQTDEALNIYENIATFSESLSNFNLGVAQMQEGDCKRAIESFQKAINGGEDRSISAVNAAACAYKLGDPTLYRYYVDLAETYLPESATLELYPYLYALVQYYKGFYLEAISPLSHFDGALYSEDRHRLLSKLYLYYGDNENAINSLEQSVTAKEYFDLALLYARVGEYQKAQNYLMLYINSGQDTSPKPHMAMEIIDLKRGNLADASLALEQYAGKEKEFEAASAFPLKVRLKETLFDVNEAQRRFWDDFSSSKLTAYKIFFYYAPYRVFDTQEAWSLIKQGGSNLLLNDIEGAKDVLLQGVTISRANVMIARALREAFSGNIRNAHEILKQMAEQQPNHSLLQYNLALSYAQLNDFDNAYKHFLRSYHLNNSDILAGVFAMITARLTFRPYEQINATIARGLDDAKLSSEERQFVLSLLGYFQGGRRTVELEWLDGMKNPKNIYLALDVASAIQSGSKERILRATERLSTKLPDDLVASLLHVLAQNYQEDPKELSLKIQNFYKNRPTPIDSVLFGPALARELYVYVGYNIGALRRVEEMLDERLAGGRGDMRGVVQALALTSIYLGEFDKAFVFYNALIDDTKERDSQTLFLAAVAAIGAGDSANAVALLQLAKLEAPTNFESRYALGLLYQEAKNLKAASLQFAAIGNQKFESDYFDFEIDTESMWPKE